MITDSSRECEQFRAIRLRVRPDLIFCPHRNGNGRRWTVKDPVSLNYFHLGDEERFLLQQLDGATSLEKLKAGYEEQFAPKTVSLAYLMDFCGRLHGNGLVLADSHQQGASLLQRRQKEQARRLWQFPLSLLAIRFPAFNARPFLSALESAGRLLFHPLFSAFAFLFALLAIALLIGQYQYVLARLPEASVFFGGTNILILFFCLAGVKIIHEFGHGLACRRFGAACNSIGVMLLVFTPCLYCDVSDAWMIPQKWQRIIVSAAGMYMEFILATLSVFLWYFSESSLMSALFLNIIVICSVSTFLFNGNPLLRYDGYFILSDAVGAPNLYEESRRALWRPLKNWLLRPEMAREDEDITSPALILYAMMSMAYRLFILGVILWSVYKALSALHLRPIGDILVFSVLMGLMVPAALFGGHLLRNPFWRRAFRWGRLGILAFAIACLLIALALMPLPRHLPAPLYVQAEGADHVYATVPGILIDCCKTGLQVAKGDVLARLENLDLQRQLVQLQGEADALEQHVQNLQLQANQSELLMAEIPTAEAALEDVRHQIAFLKKDIDRLVVTSPRAGTILPPDYRIQEPGHTLGELSFWSGTPLDPINQTCVVEEGNAICLVGDPSRLEAVLVVNQAEVEAVRVGDRVKMRLVQAPNRTWLGEVVEIASGEVSQVPVVLVSNGQVTLDRQNPGVGQPMETSYFVRVQFDEQPPGVRHGSSGIAKIVTDYETLAERLLRFVYRAFRFQL